MLWKVIAGIFPRKKSLSVFLVDGATKSGLERSLGQTA
jgi:hypothetical protein